MCGIAYPTAPPDYVPTPTEVLDAFDELIGAANEYMATGGRIPSVDVRMNDALVWATKVRAHMLATDVERFADGTPVPDEDGSAPDAEVSAA